LSWSQASVASTKEFISPLDYSKSVKRNQWIAGLSAALSSAAVGCVLAYPSPVLEQLKDELTESEKAWVASLYHLGACFGGTMGGAFNMRFGKRKTLVLIMIPFLIGIGLLVG
ncbi:unnamed protein product, partial [Notodromas monacha]